jgi:dipeptide/tripeptide permease
MFPTYGIRVFGEGAMVGSIFGVLNPVMIVFLVPLISVLTVKIRSFTMILVGTLVSAGAVFLCFIPEAFSLDLVNSAFGQLIFDYWLEVPLGQRDPFYISLIIFIIVFTIGEAIWSPRLMQFSAEIAPRGKEGSYIALAILPYFVGKALAGGMAGGLLENYAPPDALSYPDHQMVWMWIGAMAMLSPIGMVIFRKMFRKVEDDAIEVAKQIALEAKEDIEEQG